MVFGMEPSISPDSCNIQVLEISISLPKAAKIAISVVKNSNDVIQSLSSDIKQATHKFTSNLPLLRFSSSHDTQTTIGISIYEDKDVAKMSNPKASFALTQDILGLRHFSNFNLPVHVSSSGYTLSLTSQVVTPETLAYQLKRTKTRQNALEDVKALFSVPNRLTNYFSHSGVPVAIVDLLYLTIRKPSKVEDLESDILAVWTSIMKQERTFKQIFDSVPDFGVQLWNLLLKDGGKHASHYETALSVVKQLSSRPGGANLLPEIIEAFGSLSTVESCSNPQKQALMASIVPLISYFDPKYVPYIVKKTKLLSFLQSVLQNVKSCDFSTELCDHLFSLMRYIGKAHMDLFEQYQLWQPIQELSKDSQNSSRQFLAFKLLEQFGIAEDKSLESLIDSFQQTTDMRVKVKGLQLIEASIRSSPPSPSLFGRIAKVMIQLLTEPLFIVAQMAQKILDLIDISLDDYIASGLFNAYTSIFESLWQSVSEPAKSADQQHAATTPQPPPPPPGASDYQKLGKRLPSLDLEAQSKLRWFLCLFHKLIRTKANIVNYSFPYKVNNVHSPRHEKVNHAINLSLPEALQRHFIEIDLYRRLSEPLKRGWDQLDIQQHISFWMRLLKTTPELYKSHFSAFSKFLSDIYVCLSTYRHPNHTSGERTVQEDIFLAFVMIECDRLKDDAKQNEHKIHTLVASYHPSFFNGSFRNSGVDCSKAKGPEYDLAYPEGMRTEIWNSFSIELRSFFVFSLSYEGENTTLYSQITGAMLSQMLWNMQTPLEIFDLILHLSEKVFASLHVREPVKFCSILKRYTYQTWKEQNMLTMANRVELDKFARWCFLAIRLELVPDTTGNLIFKGPPLQEASFKDLIKTMVQVHQFLSTSIFSYAREFTLASQDTHLVHWYEDVEVLKSCLLNNPIFPPELTTLADSLVNELFTKSKADFEGLSQLEAVWKICNDATMTMLLLSNQLETLVNLKDQVPVPLIEQLVKSIHLKWPAMLDVYAKNTNLPFRVGFAFRLTLLLEYLLYYDEHNEIVPACGLRVINYRAIEWSGYYGCTIPTTAVGNRQKRTWSFNPRVRTGEPSDVHPDGRYVIGKAKSNNLSIQNADAEKDPKLPTMDWALRMSLVGQLLHIITSCIDVLPFDALPPITLPPGKGINSQIPAHEAPNTGGCIAVYVYMIMWMAEVVSTVAAYPCPSINKPAMRWISDSYYPRLRLPYQCELDQSLIYRLSAAHDQSKGMILGTWGSSTSQLPECLHIWLLMHSNDPEMVGKIFDASRRLVDPRDTEYLYTQYHLEYYANLMLKRYIDQLSMLLTDSKGFERSYIIEPSLNSERRLHEESSTTEPSATTTTIKPWQYAWEDVDEHQWSKKGIKNESRQIISPNDSAALLLSHAHFFCYNKNEWKDSRPMILGQDQFSDKFQPSPSSAEAGSHEDVSLSKRLQHYISVYSKAIGAIIRFLSAVSTASKLGHPNFVLDQPFITDPNEWDSITYSKLAKPAVITTRPIEEPESFPQAVTLDYTIYMLSCWLNSSKVESLAQSMTGGTPLKPSTRGKEIDRSLIPSLVDLAWNVLGRCAQIDSLPISINAHAGLILDALLRDEPKTGDSRLHPSHPQWKSCAMPAMCAFSVYLPHTDSSINGENPTKIPISIATPSAHDGKSEEKSPNNAATDNDGQQERQNPDFCDASPSRLLDEVAIEIEKIIRQIIDVYADIAPSFLKMDGIEKRSEFLLEGAGDSSVSTSLKELEIGDSNPEDAELTPAIGTASSPSDVNEMDVSCSESLSSEASSSTVPANVPPSPLMELLDSLKKDDSLEETPKPSPSHAPKKPPKPTKLLAKFGIAHPIVNQWAKMVIKLRRKLILFLKLAKLCPHSLLQKYLYRIESCDAWPFIDPTLDSAPENVSGVFLAPTKSTSPELHSRLAILAKHMSQHELVLLEGALLQKLATIVTMIRTLPSDPHREAVDKYEDRLIFTIHCVIESAVATPEEALKFITSPFWRQHCVDLDPAQYSRHPTLLVPHIGSLAARAGALHMNGFKLYRDQLVRQLLDLLSREYREPATIQLALGKDALAYTLLTSQESFLPTGKQEDLFWRDLPCEFLWFLIADAYGGNSRKLIYHASQNKWMSLKIFVISSILASSPQQPVLDRLVRNPLTISNDGSLFGGHNIKPSDDAASSVPRPLLHEIGQHPLVDSARWNIGEMQKPTSYQDKWFSSMISDYVFIRSANYHNLLTDVMAFLEYVELNRGNHYFNDHTKKFVEDSLSKVGLEPHLVQALANIHPTGAPFTHANEDIFKTNGLLIDMVVSGKTNNTPTFRAIPHSQTVNVWSERWSTLLVGKRWLDVIITDLSQGAQMRIGLATKKAIEKINKNPFLQVGDVEESVAFSSYEAGIFYHSRYLPSIDTEGTLNQISRLSSLKLGYDSSNSVLHFRARREGRNMKEPSSLSSSIIIPASSYSGKLFLVMSFASSCSFQVHFE